MIRRVLLTVLILAIATSAIWLGRRPEARGETTPVRLGAGGAFAAGFARAYEPRELSFPLDHGPHLDFQTEWWYYTGNLDTAAGEHVGFQLTFFRRGLAPLAPSRESAFASSQIYFAHFAVTDVAGGEHTSAERFSRGAAGLAGASGEPFHVWLEDWRAEALTPDGSSVRLVARDGKLALDLTLRATKPIVAHGDRGLSPKSQTRGNASYYLSFTRMATTGTVDLGRGAALAVTGESWFDHEWSTSALGAGAVGWDWFSLQLGDGRELMYFQIRREDGTLELASGGTLVEADGRTRRLAAGEVQIEVRDRWRSPVSGANYPAAWRVAVPSAQLNVEVRPWLADQEMQVSFTYWEGAVRIEGASGGARVQGVGYVEMTGYAASIMGQF